jgi:monovalent cation:H+ antiporter-2, CPA2 family
VPEAIEGSLMLASHALALVGVPMRRVIRQVQAQRNKRYNLLRGYFHGADDDTIDELDQERLQTVALPLTAYAIDKTIAQLAFDGIDVVVISLRRRGQQFTTDWTQVALKADDALVLSGTPACLAKAEDRLLRGG